MVRYFHFVRDFHKIGAIFGHRESDEKTVAKMVKRNRRNYKEIQRFIKHKEVKKNAKK
ncbi:MAG: hypothetical protein R6U27_14290 [Desulfobacterales bacterium]